MLRTEVDSQDRPAIRRAAIGVMMLAAIVTSGIAAASENVEGHRAAAKRLIVRDDELIIPSALTMNQGDVLEFENVSGQFMRLIFVEPQDQTDKIRCSPIGHAAGRADQTRWLLFDRGPEGRLRATIPPGKVASVCALAPGRYAFVARRITRDARAAEDALGTKATITVQ